MPVINPFILANKNGIPRLEATSVSINTDNVTFNFNNHPFLNNYYSGLLIFKLPSFTAPTTAVPIIFNTNGTTVNLTTLGGTNVTSAQINLSGIYLTYYDGNTLQLLNVI